MKRIFSAGRSPKIITTEKFGGSGSTSTTSQTIDTSSLKSPITPEDNEKVSPELVPILTLISAHSHRRYHEGVLLVLEDLKNDGSQGNRRWKEMYAVLIGTQLALWDANDLNGEDETSLKNSAAKPSYINFTDASIQSIETVNGVTAENDKKLENILVVSTTLKNRYFLQFSNKESLNQWNSAIRLSLYESTSLQEAYTGAFISSRGARLSDIGVLLASTKFNYEEWVSVRFGVGMPWKRCYAVITQKHGKKKDAIGEINFYESDKKIKKQKSMITVTAARSIYAVYPSSPKLIDLSTMIKLEGTATFADKDTSQETNIFIMPEKHDAVPCYDTIIRFLLPAMNAFQLYGRPKKLIANKDDPMSLLFALPTLPHIYYLQIDDVLSLTNSLNSTLWSSLEWREKIRNILQTKLTKGYSGCGSSTSLKDVMASPLLESGELFQTSGNILSPLLRSTSGMGIMSPRLNSNSSSKNKFYQREGNASKSSTSLKNTLSRSPESPLDIDNHPSLPSSQKSRYMNSPEGKRVSPVKTYNESVRDGPVGLNGSKEHLVNPKLRYNGGGPNMNVSPTAVSSVPGPVANPGGIVAATATAGTAGAVVGGVVGGIMSNVKMPAQNTEKWSNSENNHKNITPYPLDNSTALNSNESRNDRMHDNFLNPNVNNNSNTSGRNNGDLNTNPYNSPRKQRPDALNLQVSNFDSFKVSPHKSERSNNDSGYKPSPEKSNHSRAESSFSFLIDAYSEIEDPSYNDEINHNQNRGLDISMKQLNLEDDSSEHDVFDPDFVEQNQMFEMENQYEYESMSNKSKQRDEDRYNGSPQKKQDKISQEREVANIELPKNAYENINDNNSNNNNRNKGNVPSLQKPSQQENYHGRIQSPQMPTYKKAPPPPPGTQQNQQSHHLPPPSKQQPQPQQQYQNPYQQPSPSQRHQPPHSPVYGNNNDMPSNRMGIPNPYAKESDRSPNTQPMRISNGNGNGNPQRPNPGYQQSPQHPSRNTPPFNNSPVFNNQSPHNRPSPHHQAHQQPYPHPQPHPQQPRQMNMRSPQGNGMNIKSPTGMQMPRGPYTNQNNNNNNNGNNGSGAYNSPPPNRPFPGTMPNNSNSHGGMMNNNNHNNNNNNNIPPPPQMNQMNHGQMYQNQNQNGYGNGNGNGRRPIPNNVQGPQYNNNYNNGGGMRGYPPQQNQQGPFRPQPPTQQQRQMAGSPQQRSNGFNRPQPNKGGFSQFMPPSSSTNGNNKNGPITNPYSH